MFNKLKEKFTVAAKTDAFKKQKQAWGKTWHVIAPGQFIRLAEINGNFLFPQFARHHMSNLADGFMVACSFNMLQMGVSSALDIKVKSRPLFSSAASLALLSSYEYMTSTPSNRTFDWVDMSLHVASIGAFLAFCHKDKIKNLLPSSLTGPK